MNVHIVHDGKGGILSVHRTIDGLAHFLMGHGDNPSIGPAEAFGIETLAAAFSKSAFLTVSFSDSVSVIVEKHAVLV